MSSQARRPSIERRAPVFDDVNLGPIKRYKERYLPVVTSMSVSLARNALEQENTANRDTCFRPLSILECMRKDVDAGGPVLEKLALGGERFLRNIMAAPFLLGVAFLKLRTPTEVQDAIIK